MARKKNDSLSAFDQALDNFGYGNTYGSLETTNVDDILDNTDIDDLDDPDQTGTQQGAEGDGDNQIDVHDDNSDIPDHILNNTDPNSNQDSLDGLNEPDNTTNPDDNKYEQENVGLFFDAFAEELGWEVDEDKRPKDVSGLVDYISNMISENSTPQYADDRIASLDEYVKNGGKFEDFYSRQSEAMSYDNIDLEDESNQKAAVREYLTAQGYSDDQVRRKIERYEDNDMLEEEAEDAVAYLKQMKQHELEVAQQQQEQARQAQEAEAAKFMDNLTTSINSLEAIRGINIPKQDRKALFDYITKVDQNGLTQYQKDFNGNLVNNLIESAYFTMKGDALIGEAKSSGRTSAANKLRTMLRHSSTNHSRYNVNDDKQRSVVDLASQFYN